jgi:hypothetical protein
MKNIYYILLIGLFGCTKSIVFELPEIEQTIVVEATVESGLPPRVILTNSQGYFEAIDSTILSDIFIHDADVVLSDGVESFPLQEFNFNGLYIYTSLDFGAIGQFGKTYSLSIQVNDKNVYSTTTILILFSLGEKTVCQRGLMIIILKLDFIKLAIQFW